MRGLSVYVLKIICFLYLRGIFRDEGGLSVYVLKIICFLYLRCIFRDEGG